MIKKSGFKRFVVNLNTENSPRGDFAADVRRDGKFPNTETWEEIETYLISRDACAEAIEAAGELWSEFSGEQFDGSETAVPELAK